MKKFIISAIVLYALSAGATFAYFAKSQSTDGSLTSPVAQNQGEEQNNNTGENQIISIAPNAPKTEACPLNGQMFTTAEKDVWTTRRPLLVMIENHQDARPQLGLSNADVIYEAVAEGAITRFMAVFYCNAVSKDLTLGPVRSARTYFLDWASEYSDHPIYVHVGGGNTPNKANALGQIEDYGWAGRNDLNQFGLGVKECIRDDSTLKKMNPKFSGPDALVPTEHTMHCDSEALWAVAAKRGFAATGSDNKAWTSTFHPWTFADTKASSTPISKINFDFWKDYKDYAVEWNYDTASNMYKRQTGGKPHVDANTNQQLAVRTVVVQYVKETGPIDAEKHMLYGTIGTGKGLVFQDGQVFEVTWAKKNRLDRTIFTDTKTGKEMVFARGKMWVEELPTTSKVNY